MTGSHSTSDQLKLWDFGSGELVEQIQYNAALNAQKDCQIYTAQLEKTQGSLLIAGGSGANELKVFDGDASFNPCSRVYNCSRAVYSVDFNQAGEVFAMGGGDGVVRVFNIIKGMD
jgi:COMPASS component SWD3